MGSKSNPKAENMKGFYRQRKSSSIGRTSKKKNSQLAVHPKATAATFGSDVISHRSPDLKVLRLVVVALVYCVLLIRRASSHPESGEWSCELESEIRVQAEFGPGLITLDGHADDWKDIDGFEFALLPALDPDAENEYKGGKMTVKALHDGRDAFFMVQVDGDYAYSKGDDNKCPSVALMFQVGEDATYHSMGGCKEGFDSCTNKTCKGHEVDIVHFSIGNAIPGRLYGGNPINSNGNGGDRFGHLVDLYAWNPHCRYLDGIGKGLGKVAPRVRKSLRRIKLLK